MLNQGMLVVRDMQVFQAEEVILVFQGHQEAQVSIVKEKTRYVQKVVLVLKECPVQGAKKVQ